MELILQNKCVRVLIWKVTSESEVNSNPKFVPQTRWQLFTTVPKPFAQFIHHTGTKAQGSKPFFHSKENTLRHFLEKTKQKTLVWGSKKSGDAFLSVRLNEDNFGLTFQSLTRGSVCLSVCLCQNLFQFTNVIATHFLFKDVGSENMIWAETFLPFVFSLNSRLCSCPEGPLTQWPFHSAFYLSGLSSLSDVCIERDLLHV